MDLTEFQAKTVLRKAGGTVPDGDVAKSKAEAVAIYRRLGDANAVVKAQIRAGGRANGQFTQRAASGGGVRFVSNEAELIAACDDMLSNVLVTDQTGAAGEYVQSVYIENKITISTERYVAICIDRERGSIAFLVSNEGGTGIETMSETDPNHVKSIPIDIDSEDIPREVIDYFSVSESEAKQLLQLIKTMKTTFVDKDATLIECNPFGFTEQGELAILDARIVWDDNALFRQGHEEQMVAYDHLSESEFKAICLGLNYIRLDGNIGTLSAGAGLAMATLDAVKDCGGESANFLDLPPSSTVAEVVEAFSIVRSDDQVRAIIVNVIGGGIMRCDAIVDALLISHEKKPIEIPLVVRLAGTNAVMAIQRLQSTLPKTIVTNDLATAAREVVGQLQATSVSKGSGFIAKLSRFRKPLNQRSPNSV